MLVSGIGMFKTEGNRQIEGHVKRTGFQNNQSLNERNRGVESFEKSSNSQVLHSSKKSAGLFRKIADLILGS